MREGRSVADMLGGGAPAVGGRANPTWAPTPNSLPTGAKTGAPPHTRMYSVRVPVGQTVAIVQGTPENRIVLITPPSVGFNVFVGDSGVSVNNGYQLAGGGQQEVLLVGLQELYAVSNAPVSLVVQIMISIILAAEQARPT